MSISRAAPGTSQRLLIVGLLLLASPMLGPTEASATKNLSLFQDRTIIRIWGVGSGTRAPSPLLGVLAKLEADYRRDRPDVSFVHNLKGNDSALGGIYVGAADIALMDRDPSYIELDGYQQVIAGQKPFMAAFMRGGIAKSGHSSPLVVIVNRRNPIETLSVAQLEIIFNAADSVARPPARLWSDLGLKQGWASRPIHLFGFGVETSEARTFSKAVMGGSRRWPCAYHEMVDTPSEGAARRVVDAVSKDSNAIGISTFDAVSPAARVVAIDSSNDGASRPAAETLASGRYILGRSVLAVARAQKDGQVGATIRDFLSYLLNARAQTIIAQDKAYVPLDEAVLASERRLLR